MHAVVLIVLLQTAAAVLTLRRVTASGTKPARRSKPLVAYDDNGRLLLFGGTGRGGDETWIFEFGKDANGITVYSTGAWHQLSLNPRPPHRFYGNSGAVAGGSFMIATGEDTRAREFYNDAWLLEKKKSSPSGTSVTSAEYEWKNVLPQVEDDDVGENRARKRYGGASAVYNNQLCVGYGFSDRRYSDMFCIGTSGTSTRIYEGNSAYDLHNPHPRCLGAHSNLGDKLLMFGGCLSSGFAGGPCPSKDTWEWDFAEQNWTRADDHPVPSVHTALASFDSNYALQYGGDTEFRNQKLAGADLEPALAFLYRSSSKSWKPIRLELDANAGITETLTHHDLLRINARTILVIGVHGNEDSVSLWLIEGDPSTAQEWDKELTSYFGVLALHGIFMVIGWGFFIQVGSYIFRYWRHKPWAFKLHRILNSVGLLFALCGLVMVFKVPGDPRFTHGVIGLLVMIAGISQPLSALFRCHKPEGDSPHLNRCCALGWAHRWKFNVAHHMSGRFALIFSLINISLGFPLLVVENIGLWFGLWFTWFAILVVVYIVSEILVFTEKIPPINRTPEENYYRCVKAKDEDAGTKEEDAGKSDNNDL
eukprot:GEMP01011889.1.p1 GENE.GEMP01011889.1~~GEMP01011889.1.p1  ORF type:complete len:592 (+),score=113.39 GEMP01011889.1:209-1984(+)